MYHPWRALRALVDWTYHEAPLPDGLLGVTDHSERTITLAPGQSQAQRRSTMAHEVVHVERGPTLDTLADWDERRVEQEAARRLVPFEQLVSSLLWARNVHELAEELWVDVDIVQCRLDHLHPSERSKLAAMMRQRDDVHEEPA